MNRQELLTMLNEYKKIFEVVRIVDATMKFEYSLSETNDLTRSPRYCYDLWERPRCCQNCIAQKAFLLKSLFMKFEVKDGQVYVVLAKYIEVESQPYVLELINKVQSDALFNAFGKIEFIQSIMDFSKAVYVDPLTGAYNRRFFEEQFPSLENHCAVAFVDLDRFKSINDTYGHDAGDKVLKAVVKEIMNHVRAEDKVIRYGGEEFVLSFAQMPKNAFRKRLEEVQSAVKTLVISEYPEIKITVSIGGVYCNNCNRMDIVKDADRLCYEAKIKRDDIKLLLH